MKLKTFEQSWKIFSNKIIDEINETHQGYHAGDNCCSDAQQLSRKGSAGAGPRT